jgi:hypothetical protein
MQPLDGSESLVIDCSVTMAWYLQPRADAFQWTPRIRAAA